MRGLPAHLTRLMLAGALLSHTGVNAAAQGQGGETLKMRPYGILAGCSEEPARFHPCALEKARTFNPPRTPDGQPDFRGVWARARVTSDNILDYAEVVGAPGGKSMVVDPPDGKIPYQPWAVIKQRENLEHYIAPKAMCFPPAPPLQAYSPGPYQILQEPGRIIFLHDFSHAYRIIHTDGRPHVPIAARDDHGRFARALGRQHARRRRHESQWQGVVRQRRQFLQCRRAPGGTLDDDCPGCHPLRGHD